MDSALAETEQLVQQLYRPATPVEVDHVQKQLQAAQRSSGWFLANGLMHSSDQNVRFFAALTFIVKINQDGGALNEQDLDSLLLSLLAWLVRLVTENEGLLVLRKLCSTLVTLFVLPNSTWRQCIRHVLCCLHSGIALPEAVIAEYPDNTEIIKTLNARQLAVMMTFSRNLAEDAARIDHTSQKLNYCHERVEQNLDPAIAIMRHSFALIGTQSGEYQSDVLYCYQSWIEYARREYSHTSDQLQHLRYLFANAVQCLFVEEVFEAAAEVFTDLFISDDKFLTSEDRMSFAHLLDTPWAFRYLTDLERDDAEYGSIIFGQLVAAFAQAVSEAASKAPAAFRHVLEVMHRITRTQRFGNVDQNLSNAIVDFWESFISHVGDVAADFGEGSALINSAKGHWLHAIDELCTSTRLPLDHNGEFKRLGSDHPFSEFRLRVQNAVQSSYSTFEFGVLEKLVEMALKYYVEARGGSYWTEIEATFNCLGGLSESMKYQASNRDIEDEILGRLFGSPMYQELTTFTGPIPTKLRKKAINIIGEHDEFLGRHPPFLLNALEILFGCLAHSALAENASHAIFTLCDPNRKLLSSKIVPLLDASEQFFSSPQSSSGSKEDIAASIAAIAQALSAETEPVQAISKLLTLVEQDLQSKLESFHGTSGAVELYRSAKLETLAQLSAIGKAFQVPDDVPIDLDADDDMADVAWKPTQSRIIHLLGMLLDESIDDGAILEETCNVLQTGYRETRPGPFVFDPQVTVDLVLLAHRNTPRLDAALRTAAILISSYSARRSRIEAAIPALLTWICNVVDPSVTDQDPEVSYACMDFMSRLVPYHVGPLSALPAQCSRRLFDLSIQCLASADMLPKRAAAGLWTSLLSTTLAEAQLFIEQLLGSYGSDVTAVLVQNFGGNAARSQLEWLTEPYRKLVMKRPRSSWKGWTEQALFGSAFPSNRVSDADKRRFLAQVEQLRGDRKTNTVVKEFWLACRGTPVAYG